MIPPDRDGYGELMRASLLTAREFYERLVHWDAARACGETLPYRLLPITAKPPDTNIVCFLVTERAGGSVARTNAISRRIFESFTLGERDYSYSQPFFLSRTIFGARATPHLLSRHCSNTPGSIPPSTASTASSSCAPPG